MKKSNIVKAYIWRSFGVIAASSGPSIFMLIAPGIAKETAVMYFLFIGGLVTLLIYYTNYLRTKHNQSVSQLGFKEQLIKSLERTISVKLFCAGLAFAAHFVFFICAMKAESITETVIVVRISPLLVVFLSILILKERIKSGLGISYATIVCLLAVILIEKISLFSLKNFLTPFLLFAFVAALAIAFSSVMTIDIRKRSGLAKEFITGITMLAGGIGLLIWILVVGGSLSLPGVKQLLFLSYLGIATAAFPVFANLQAVSLIGSMGRIAFVEYFQVVFGVIFAHLINKEAGFDYLTLAIGFLLILTSALVVDRSVEARNKIQ